jgi:hypothetical protein
MYQVISSSIVAAPPSAYVMKLLHSSTTKQLYVPLNGHRSNHQPSDTKEDMMEIFQNEPDGRAREYRKLMGRRNYVAIVAYDPNDLAAIQGGMQWPGGSGMSVHSAGSGGDGRGLTKLSLAVDFVVQGEGAFNAPTKYGPVIIPSLEFGR